MDDKPFEDAVALLKIVEAETDPGERARLLGVARKTIRRVCLQQGVTMGDADIEALMRVDAKASESALAAAPNERSTQHGASESVVPTSGAEYWIETITRTVQRLSDSANVAPPSHFCLRHG